MDCAPVAVELKDIVLDTRALNSATLVDQYRAYLIALPSWFLQASPCGWSLCMGRLYAFLS